MTAAALIRRAALPLEALLLLAGFSATVRFAPPAVTGRLVQRAQRVQRRAAQLKVPPVQPVVASVQRAARWVPGNTCLSRALTGLVMLRRRRADANLQLGVASTKAAGLGAHAWLVHEGRIVLGAEQAEALTQLRRS